MKNKYILTITILGLTMLTACGNKNKTMYDVKEEPVVQATPKATKGYGYVEASVASNADSDKSLGKKRIVTINGRPIAEIIGDYENEYGYNIKEDGYLINDNEVVEFDKEQTEETKDSHSINIMDLIISEDNQEDTTDDTKKNDITHSSKFLEFKEFCDSKSIYYFEINMEELEEQAKTNDNIQVSNELGLRELVMTYGEEKDSLILFYMGFDNESDAKLSFEELKTSQQEYDSTVLDGKSMYTTVKAGDDIRDGVKAEVDTNLFTYLQDDYIVMVAYPDSNEDAKEISNDLLKKLDIEPMNISDKDTDDKDTDDKDTDILQ